MPGTLMTSKIQRPKDPIRSQSHKPVLSRFDHGNNPTLCRTSPNMNFTAAPSSSSEASSSSRSQHSNGQQPPLQPQRALDHDEPDLFGSSAPASHNPEDNSIFASDPLGLDIGLDQPQAPLSFKRKQKQSSILSQPARLFTALTGGTSNQPRRPSPPRDSPSTPENDDDVHLLSGPGATTTNNLNTSKDGVPLDWYVEGPGRRVGYEDMTAIDWIFEYTKERQRLRYLRSSAHGLLGYARQFADASQVWVVLVLTGLAVGAVAAGIDVTTNWLGDLKGGYCSGEDGGAFYLNNGFCCLGYDDHEMCKGWRTWSAALGVGSKGGKWFVEYFFFTLFSVTFALVAGVLVQEYAIYAKHSGIPEIKTVLGGFIIRRFLGTWTLVTKSLGLVRYPCSGR